MEKLTMPVSARISDGTYTAFNNSYYIKQVVLTSGNGNMQDFTTYSYKTCLYYGNTPWAKSSKTLESIEILNGVKCIGDAAFYNCETLKSIPESIESIGEYAFYGCTGLKDTVSLNAKTIKSNAFNGCTSVDKFIFYNPDCLIYDAGSTIPKNALICGYENSTAQEYAEKYNRDFLIIDNGECNHLNTENRNFIAVSCSKNGYTGDTYCNDCEMLLSVGEIVSATGHQNTTTINAKPATCTETGYTGDAYCSDCETVIANGEPIEATGHDWGEITYTWSEDNTTCTAIKPCLNDSAHNITETVKPAVTTVEPTCEKDGSITYTAAFNNKTFYTQEKTECIPATNHRNAYLVRGVSATCTTVGYEPGMFCPDCKQYISGHELIEAIGHKPTPGNAIPATCTSTGLTAGTYCSVCGVVITAQETIPATDHKDNNNDGYCDTCNADIGTHTTPDNCTCNCHKSGISNFFWKILNFFHKLFGMNQYRYCACKKAHW